VIEDHFQVRTEEVHHHNVVVSFLPVKIEFGDRSYGIKDGQLSKPPPFMALMILDS
jgi:hypothetical protein